MCLIAKRAIQVFDLVRAITTATATQCISIVITLSSVNIIITDRHPSAINNRLIRYIHPKHIVDTHHHPPIFLHHLPSITMDHTRNMCTMDLLGEPTCRNQGSKLKNFREGKDTEEGAWNNGGGE